MKIETLYQKFCSSTMVSTDTRKLVEGCMYFALKGDNFDGNLFVSKAFEGGAKFCVVDNQTAAINNNCILVEDVLSTLQELAKYHRNKINIKIISLTGSNGKTTTKELIQSVLASIYKVKATKGNLNNHIGVPLTLLDFTKDLDFGIVEMGANHKKEIEFLCTIAQPDFGVITNFGKAHLEGFGSIEGVIKAKSELYNHLINHNKTVFVNTDDHVQVQQVKNYSNVITFGSRNENDSVATFKSANPYVSFNFNNVEINSQLIGDYNYGNIAVAAVIGEHFNVPTDEIKTAIESYQPDNNRSEIIIKGTNRIILDAYNANPTSMLAALKNLNQIESKNKYLILGDMFELGAEAETEHQAIADYAEKQFEKNIFLIGENFFKTETNNTTHKFLNFEDFNSTFKNIKFNNATLLIKGSRGMALERVLKVL